MISLASFRRISGSIALLVLPLALATAALDSSADAATEKKAPIRMEMLKVKTNGLATGVRKRILPSYPFSADGPMWLNGEPERLRCSFGDDRLEETVIYGQRQIIVYPVAEYRKLFSGPDQLKEFDKRLKLMKTAIASRKVDAKEIAVLPSIDACQLIRSRVAFLNFDGGSGVRFVSRYATDVSPTTGNDLFYTFQGLTEDGRYWVSVFYPVNVTGLRETTDAAKSTRSINKLAPRSFSPQLEALDAMVRSIKIR